MKKFPLVSIPGRLVRKVKRLLHPIRDISDEYTDLLAGINAGWLERGNLYSLDYAIKNLPSTAPIVEVGSFCGLSTNLIAYYKQKNDRRNKLFNCDKWEWNNTGNVGTSSVNFDEYLSYAMETYRRNVQMFSRNDLPYTIKEFSDEFFTLWGSDETVKDIFGREIKLGGPIGFCFIDGNHEFEFAKRDFYHADKFLEKGGFILLDDSADGTHWDVARVRDEAISTGRYEVVVKNPNYLFRKK